MCPVLLFWRVARLPAPAGLQFLGAHGVVVSHPLRMRKALGSNPSVSTELCDRRLGAAMSAAFEKKVGEVVIAWKHIRIDDSK